MPRRVTMPGAEELFRPTTKKATGKQADAPADADDVPLVDSGRVKHDEKMTVYLTAEELLAIEQARLQLRVALGRTVDRGRFVRAALAEALADLDANGTDSAVAQRLSST